MKCLKRQTIIDYINKEISGDAGNSISIHLESCEKCLEAYHRALEQIQAVRAGMDMLSPESIPETTFCLPKETENIPRRNLTEKIKEKLNFPSGFGWEKAVACAFFIFIIASIFSFRTNHESDEMEMQQYLMAAENYYRDDPKAGWDEKGLVIAIFNKEKNTLELVETSMDDSETTSVKFEVEE